jgi:hypothetical protein
MYKFLRFKFRIETKTHKSLLITFYIKFIFFFLKNFIPRILIQLNYLFKIFVLFYHLNAFEFKISYIIIFLILINNVSFEIRIIFLKPLTTSGAVICFACKIFLANLELEFHFFSIFKKFLKRYYLKTKTQNKKLKATF